MNRKLRGPGFQLSSPVFFPSVSSLRARAPIADHLEVIEVAGFPTALISAADLHSLSSSDRELIERWCSTSADAGRVVMLDSGGYEGFWKEWADWSQDQLVAVSDVPVGIRLGLDAFWNQEELSEGVVREAIEAYRALETYSGIRAPVVHAPSEHLREVVREVVESLNCDLIAVAERDLGWGIRDRCSLIARLRSELELIRPDCFLHVLGAGSPHDILALWLSGADSFDGLEWCRAVIHPVDRSLECLSRWQLIAPVSVLGAEADTLPYFHGMALSNLIELSRLIDGLNHSSWDEGYELAGETLPKKLVEHLASLDVNRW